MKKLHRSLSWLLLLAMLFSMLSVGGFATDDTGSTTTDVVETTSVPAAEEEAPAVSETPVAEAPAQETPAQETPADTQNALGIKPVEDEKVTTESANDVEVQKGPHEQGGGGGGTVEQPNERYYDATHQVGYDSFNSSSTTAIKNGVAGVSANGNTVSLNNSYGGATTGDAYTAGFSVIINPGYKLNAYKIACSDKYSCETIAHKMGENVRLTVGVTGTYEIKGLKKEAFGHSNPNANPYWLLLDIEKDDTKYHVTYDWGILNGTLKSAVPVDTNDYLVNSSATVKAPSTEAIAEAKANGYEFIGWVVEGDGYDSTNNATTSGATITVSGNLKLIAQWEEIPTQNITITKKWVDNSDQDGKRPASITVTLERNGEAYVAPVTVTGTGDTWTYTFEGVPKEGTYTVTENAVNGYTTTVNGYTITNTHTPETTSVSGTKTWDDDDNRDGIRPDDITVTLTGKVDGRTVYTESKKVEDNNTDEWNYSFTNLPKYNGGKEITYTVSEEAVNGYTPSYSETGYDITNTHTPATYEKITVTKVWEDNENQDGKRTDSVVVALMKGDIEVGTLTLNEGNKWTGSFENIPVNAGGKQINYSVVEKTDLISRGYTSVVSGTALEGFTVTNTHTPETTSVSGTKTWDDDDNRDGIRPDDITVTLTGKVDGETVYTEFKKVEDNNTDEWNYSFTNLPKYNGGKEITYSVKEVMDEKTAELYDGAVVEGTYDLVNTHNPEKVTVTVTKVWEDKNNQDGVRPNSIKFDLYANDEKVNEKPYVITAKNNWTLKITDLYKNEGGEEITYTVKEVEVDKNYEADADGLVITNTHEPEKTEVTVTKKWDDAKNQDGIRPGTVTVALMKETDDGLKEVTRATFEGEGDVWEYTFKNLDKNENGKAIQYSVQELEVTKEYKATVDGFVITNTHTPETTSVTVNKVWADNNDQDGIRPEEITVYLTVKGEKEPSYIAKMTPDKDGKWSYTFFGLPKFKNGEEIKYVVSEEKVEGYESEVSVDQQTGEVTITNTHDAATTKVSIEKVWKDNNDKKEKRPDSIKVTLYANGKEVTTVELNEKNQWKTEIENLPVNANGKAVEYTVKEAGVKYYVGKVTGSVKDGFTVTNTFVDIPLTGDTMNLLFWSIMILGAGAVLTGVTVHSRRKRA